MKRKIKVIQFGLGEIGTNIARALLKNGDRFELIGCVDNSPEKANVDIGELVEPKEVYDLQVAESISSLRRRKADVVVHAAGSFLPEAGEQVARLMELGYNVMTTAEELFFLRRRDPALFKRLDALAKRKRVRLLATGINPGFVMDSLVLMLTAPCISVSGIRAERMVNLSRRRLALKGSSESGWHRRNFSRELDQVASGRLGSQILRSLSLTTSVSLTTTYIRHCNLSWPIMITTATICSSRETMSSA